MIMPHRKYLRNTKEASMKKTATYLILYSSAHFFIDFTCAYLMFARVSGSSQFALMLFFYNFCAFALQMPLGLVTDLSLIHI